MIVYREGVGMKGDSLEEIKSYGSHVIELGLKAENCSFKGLLGRRACKTE